MKAIKVIYVLTTLMVLGCRNNTINNNKTDQSKRIGGGCEDCEIMYIDMPKKILPEHTSIGWQNGKQKLIITGKIFKLDGKTPMSDAIVYYWHTDDNGLYSSNINTPDKAKKHGKLRGWVKADKLGNYTIKTSRPASYPNENIPQHIHLSIKEKDLPNEYYADLYFDDDKLYLTHKKKYGKADRAGSELLRVLIQQNVQIAEHDIILGLNIPNYPKQEKNEQLHSGLEIGEDQPSFAPYHAFGEDKGSQVCPVCKYGRYHGIIFFTNQTSNWLEIKSWLTFLDMESIKREKYLKVYFVLGLNNKLNNTQANNLLEDLGKELKINNLALTYVPSFSDASTDVNLNKINSDMENTFIIYKHRTIIDKYVNLKPTSENFKKISSILDITKGNYFNLDEPKHD